MLDKFKYKLFDSRIPRNIYNNPKNSVLCKTGPEISKSKVFYIFDGGHFEYCKNGGSNKISVASIKILK